MRVPLLLTIAALAAAPLPAQSLLDTLTALSNKELTAWQLHDKPGYLANRDPEFMYVGPLGIIEPTHPVDNLMRCTVNTYTITKTQVVTLGPETAILIAEQHQDATCFNMKQPAVVNITETYTRRSGSWKLILRTESPTMTLPNPKG